MDTTSKFISEFAGRVSFHGIGDLYESRKNKCLVCIWLLSILVAFCFCGYCCSQVLAQYSVAPNIIALHYVSRSAGLTPPMFQFPEIYACPGIPIKENIIRSWECNNSRFIGRALYQSYGDPLALIQLFMRLRRDPEPEYHEGLINLTNKCFASRNLSYGQAFCSSVNTITDIFDPNLYANHRLLTKYGSCIQLELKEKEDMNDVMGYDEAEFNVLEYDFLHHFKEHLIWITFNGAFNVPVLRMKKGFDTYLTVRQSCYSFQANSITLPNCNNKQPARYSECLGECVFGYSMRKCHCRLVDAYVYDEAMHLPICSYESIIKCFPSLEVSKEATFARYKRCHSHCKPCRFCTAEVFSTTEAKYYDVPKLRIRLPLDYVLIEEIPSKTWEQFIAEIGGQLSLWIGGSILSIVQLVVFGVRYFYHKGVSLNQRNKVESIQIP